MIYVLKELEYLIFTPMTLKYQYILFIAVLHIVLTVLIYQVLKDNKWYFILSESLIIGSLVLSYSIYDSFIKPIELMKNGINAIKEEDFNVKFLKTQSREINDLIGIFNTMLDRLGEERVRTQEQAYFLESIIAASPIGMIILGYSGEISNMNVSAKKHLSMDKDSIPRAFEDIAHPLVEEILKVRLDDPTLISPDGIQKYRCQITEVIHKGFKRKFVMIEELSKELLKSEKEAYGKVIRMMAHEVNNSMGAVNSILQSVIDFAFEDAETDNEYVASLTIAKSRNEDLARFMKNFADVIRLPPPVLNPTDIIPLVQRTVQIMQPLANESQIDIKVLCKEENVLLAIDRNQIEQVLVNIIKNAIESIQKEGEIKITIGDDQPQIIIADNGRGISGEVKDKLFSPFFSTKPTGQGIGLIIIRDILIGHSAVFSLETNRETGWTEFWISLGAL